ncbi:MAG: site-specific DNA-methyltransferase [Terriglobales bacterium]
MATARALAPNKRPRRKSPAGVATNDLVFSAYVGDNSEIFRNILFLYVEPGSKVADVTYGKGVFWRGVPQGAYRLFKSDLRTGTDFRNLPYEDSAMDCLVLDPPYMHTPGGSAHVNHQNYENYYRNNGAGKQEAITGRKYHEAVLDLYSAAAKEALRVLRPNGFFIVKCADEVCANRQRLTHVELISGFATYGFVAEDIFVLVRRNRPGVSRVLRQAHARKNHSYFLVFRKPMGKTRWQGVRSRPVFSAHVREELPLFPRKTD